MKADIKANSPCAFCKGEIALGYENDEPVAFHTMPVCDKFLNTELSQFLEDNRVKLSSN